MESMLQFFEEVPDFRSDCGKRYSMGQMLSMITLSYMSGNYAMQATRRYFENNEEELVDMFGLEHGVPSYDLIRTFLMGVKRPKYLISDSASACPAESGNSNHLLGDRLWDPINH